ncbi:hypothetical protein HPB48_017181 [Haemaphysalis longicornis]|uniref:Ubiquitin-conjugating enzyme E2 Z n=1 Tax=Haemaphysalis longicornis TaxID=44386 RepID=A0A9J6GLB2_HAELO|nr:hypothetical protein HPB48_017181 [Haemaphysalis longicornis]
MPELGGKIKTVSAAEYTCSPRPNPQGQRETSPCLSHQLPLTGRAIHALIVGPRSTPYEGGLFHFLLKCPPDYPIRPPRVRLMTTDGGAVRFGPNLYADGKVCLSILG